MQFRILGPLRVWDGAGWAQIRAPQQRTLLAVLLLEAGRPVPVDRVIDEIWGEHPPSAAKGTVQGYVMRLRRLLGVGECPLLTRGHGYELVVEDDDLDAALFQRLAESGRRGIADGKLDIAVAQLSEGLSLWRGATLADVPATPAVAAAAQRLDQARITALEMRLEARIALGEHAEVVDELTRLVDEHPLRERLWTQLMLALYRCGRRAEALTAYQRARGTLVEDLGLEPGRPLRDLHAAILAEDDDLAAPHRVEPRQAERVTPAQLPADIAAFTGRAEACAELDGLLPAGGSHLPLVVLTGIAGSGKTALAVHWAHRARRLFPDGQLYVDLRGYSAGTPLRPLEVLTRFLVALGVPPARVPSDVDDATAMFRSQLADRRVLVLLDNANHPDQVRPLLPNGPGCFVLATSRDHLAGLLARDGAVRLALDSLTPGEAQTLLTRLVGADRAGREPGALTRLAELCGYLPLALRIAAANLVVEPAETIAGHTDRLAADRLGTLRVADDQHAAVRIAFDHSYAALPEAARRLFRLLGLVPGPHFTTRTAAALANLPVTQAASLLDRLAAAHLLDEHTQGRYSFHDLLRDYAAGRAVTGESAPDRDAAIARLHEHYLHGVNAAAGRLYPHVLRLPEQPDTTRPAIRLDDHRQASAWLDAERPNLVAAVPHAADHGFTELAWRLADALRGYLYLRMHTEDWRRAALAGLAAARAGGDAAAQAAAHASLATLHWAQGRHQEAIDQFTDALSLARRAGWTEGGSAALGNLGNLNWALGRLEAAAEHYAMAIDLYRRTGQPAGEATALGNLGLVHLGQGRLDLAVTRCTEALALHRNAGSRSGEARTMTHLGETYLALHRHDEAIVVLTDALRLLRQIGDRNTEGDTLRALAAAHRDTGDTAKALDLAAAAVDLARDTGDRRLEAGTLTTRASIHDRLGHHPQAVDGHQQALRIAADIGNTYLQTEAMIGLATATSHTATRDETARLAGTALAAAEKGGYGLLRTRAEAVLAELTHRPH